MAFKSKKAENNKTYFEMAEYKAKVTRVRIVTAHMVSFTLSCAGFALYNMKLVEKADGTFFIAPPSTKGKDGNYYNQYAIYLSPDDEEALIDTVLELVNND